MISDPIIRNSIGQPKNPIDFMSIRDQPPITFRSAPIGTTGALISFRLGFSNAETMADEFHLTRDDVTLTRTQPFSAYRKPRSKSLYSYNQLRHRVHMSDHRLANPEHRKIIEKFTAVSTGSSTSQRQKHQSSVKILS